MASCNRNPLVWVVDSSYTGELNARIGVAVRLGYGYEIIPLPNGNATRYQNLLLDKYKSSCNGDRPYLLILSGTGEETTAEIADLRSLFNDRLFTLYLASILPDEIHPRLTEYNLIASPQLSGKNIITLTGVPHQLTQQQLSFAYCQHANFFSSLKKPIMGLLVGGNTRYCDGFDESHAKKFARRALKIAKAMDASIVVTNSRRTPETSLKTLLNELEEVTYRFLDWQKFDVSLYHALLAHADMFIVTGDSLSMCSEAAFTGKPILADLSVNATECFHRDIVGQLIQYGAAKLLGDHFEPWLYVPPDPTGSVVAEIQAHFSERKELLNCNKAN